MGRNADNRNGTCAGHRRRFGAVTPLHVAQARLRPRRTAPLRGGSRTGNPARQDLPGQELFQYMDEAGRCRRVTSGDVNDNPRQATGREFTAKDFRTWAGTVLAAQLLQELPAVQTGREARSHVVQVIKQVAERLGNTAAGRKALRAAREKVRELFGELFDDD